MSNFEKLQDKPDQLSFSQQLYHLTNVLPVGIFRTDIEGGCIYVNEFWCLSTGFSAEQALGDGWIKAIYPADREYVLSAWQDSVRTNIPFELECRFIGAENKTLWVLVRAVEERNQQGERIGYLGSVTDITLNKEQEIKSNQYHNNLLEVQRITRLGFFEHDLSSQDTYWSEEIYHILGLQSDQTSAGFEALLKYVHPDDVEPLMEAREQLLNDVGFYNIDYRIIRPDGGECYLHGEARLYVNKEYPAGKIMGTIQDISERKYIEKALNTLIEFSTHKDLQSFYKNIVFSLSRVYGARYAFLGLFSDDSLEKITTQAIWAGDGFAENIEYELKGTPCADVLNNKIDIIPDNVVSLYPCDTVLADMEVNSYYGIPLVTPSGEKIGLISVMSTHVMQLGHWTKSILSLFAQHVASLIDHSRIENEIKSSQETLSSILENMQDIYYRTDAQGLLTIISSSGKSVLGYNIEEMLGTPLADLYIDPRDRAVFLQKMSENGGYVEGFEAAMRHADGHQVWMSANSHYYYDEAGNIAGVEGVTRDMTRQHIDEIQMQKMSSALEQTADMVIITDIEGITEYVNPAFERVSGFSKEEVIGKKSNLLKSGRHDDKFYKRLWGTVHKGESFKDVMVNKKKDGSLFYEDKTITPLKNSYGDITHFISTGRDISQRMEHEKRLQYIAHHDALTDLPNRVLFMDRIYQALGSARRYNKTAAILFIDLDRFKNINDTLGHVIGDKLLVKISRSLEQSIREGDTIARLGGDEFAVLVNNISSENDVVPVAQKILNCLDQSVDIDGHGLYVTASIGVSLFPYDGEDADTLLKHADIAMYRAKDLGKNNYQFYSKDMSARASQRLILENGLRLALENKEFVLHYQPQIDINTNTIIGFEALIRWQHPQMGVVPPNDFISLLEETGLIVEVGEWIVDTACHQLKSWEDAGYTDLRMSVNVSGRQFHHKNFYAHVVDTVEKYGISPQRLELEITESILMDNQQKTIKIIDELDAHGFRIAIDDFGTGYSSLSYLRRFRIDTLKVDQSFIRDVIDDLDDAAITSAIIAMAHSLKLEIVAEGVENRQQLDFLLRQNCQLVQGYFFSRPQEVDRITELLVTGISPG